jgi:hypothetical protein
VVGGDKRHRHGGQSEKTSFHRRRHGSGIDHVIAQVGGVVDAGHDDVGFDIQHSRQRKMHAIGRRAGDAPGLLIQLLDADGQIQGQRIAGAGAVAVWCHHQDFMACGAQALRKDSDAGGVYAVVVTYQYAHGVPQVRPHDTARSCALPRCR